MKPRDLPSFKYRKSLPGKTLQAHRLARSNCQRIVRKCANNYWLNLYEDVQIAADFGSARTMYNGMKIAFGPTVNTTAPLKSTSGAIITHKKDHMKRWAEHYQELYSQLNIVTDAAVNNMNKLPTMNEDRLPSLVELLNAIDSLACNKAPSKDGVRLEVSKVSKNNSLVNHLYELLCQCWDEGTISQGMRDTNIITLYKNKGDRSECNNYRGISLLSIVGKAFARASKETATTCSPHLPRIWCGFRANRSTIDMIFSLWQLQEKCREQRQPLFIAFINLTKDFDLC